VTRGAAHRLDQRIVASQESFLVRVENRHQRHLGHVESLAQQVDAHQHVELAEPQIADDLHPLHRLHVRMQVTHLHTVLVQVFREVF